MAVGSFYAVEPEKEPGIPSISLVKLHPCPVLQWEPLGSQVLSVEIWEKTDHGKEYELD